MAGSDLDRSRRGPAEVDRDPGALSGAHLRRGSLEPIMRTRVRHRPRGGPHRLQHGDILVRPGVARILVEPVAVAPLVRVVAARDDVDRGPAAAELVERREAPRREGRRDEPRPMRDEETEPLGLFRHEAAEQQALRSVGVIADEHAIEAARLMG